MSDNSNQTYFNPLLTNNEIMRILFDEFSQSKISKEELQNNIALIINRIMQEQNHRLMEYLDERVKLFFNNFSKPESTETNDPET